MLATAAYDIYGKSHKWIILILLTIIFYLSLPKMSLLFLVWIIPGFFIGLLIFKNIDLFTRIAFGFVISLCLMISSILLSYLGIPVGRWIILIIFFASILTILSKQARKNLVEIFSSKIDHKLFSFLIAILIGILFIYSPFFNESALPQTTAVDYYSSGQYVERTIIEQHSFPIWEIKSTLGQARYTLDSPAYFWYSGVSGVIFGKGTLFIYNQAFIFLIIISAMFLFLALKKISKYYLLSLLITILFFSSKTIGQAVGASGNMKGFAGICIGIISLYFLVMLKETKEIKYFFFLLINSGIAVLFHPVSIYLTFGIIITSMFCLEKKRFTDWKFYTSLAMTGLIFMFWIIPFIHYSYSTSSSSGFNMGINLHDYILLIIFLLFF